MGFSFEKVLRLLLAQLYWIYTHLEQLYGVELLRHDGLFIEHLEIIKLGIEKTIIFPSILARGLMLILNSGLSATTYPTVDLLYRFCLLLWSYTSLCPLYSSYFRYFFAFAVGFYLGVSKVGDGQAYFNYFCYYYPFVFLLFS